MVEPVIAQERLLVSEIDMNSRRLWKAWFDPMGHYSRPDVYNLHIRDSGGHERITWRHNDDADERSPAVPSDLATDAGNTDKPRPADAVTLREKQSPAGLEESNIAGSVVI